MNVVHLSQLIKFSKINFTFNLSGSIIHMRLNVLTNLEQARYKHCRVVHVAFNWSCNRDKK